MIIISQGLVLSPVDDVGPDNPVIGYRNLVTPDALMADFEAAGFPVTNLANPNTSSMWIGEEDYDEQYIEVEISTSDDIDYIAIARHNFGSDRIEVAVEAYTETDMYDEPIWVELFPGIMPADDRAIIWRFEPQSLAGIRLRLEPGDDAPMLAVLYVGRLLVLQRRIYVGHTPITYGRRAQITSGRSETGNFIGRIVTGEHLETSVSLQNITPAWYRSQMEPFVKAAQTEPFFFAWRPQSYPLETGFAALANEPQPTNQRSNGMMQIDLDMIGVAP